ncbi:MAG: ABC transporter permease subunit [Firmicutes bacterium]|nr:ABC transporter permease subunit [Bacillota bacterium]
MIGKKERFLPYLYIAPAVVLMIFLTLLPNIYSLYIAFTNYSLYHFQHYDFVGLRNFVKVFSGSELQEFMSVFAWTMVWALASVFGMVLIGLLLAFPLNNRYLKGKDFYRTMFVIPWAIPAFITVLMWQGILNSDLGAVNVLLMGLYKIPIFHGLFGMLDGMTVFFYNIFHGMHIDFIANLLNGFHNFLAGFNGKIPWLDNGNWARVSVLIVNIWLGFPFMMSIIIGALQAIPSELYEAASVDGATPTTQFFAITVPLLRSAMLPVIISSFAFNFNQFGSIYLLTAGGPTVMGRTAGQTDILVTYSYKLAFNMFRFGLACAYAVFIFIIIASLSSVNFKLTGAFDD